MALEEPRIAVTVDEVQQAHDLLGSILQDPKFVELIFGSDRETRMCVQVAMDALCWMLGHEYNADFGKWLATIRREVSKLDVARVDLSQAPSALQ